MNVSTLSIDQKAGVVAEHVSAQAGESYKFERFINIGKPSMMFVSNKGTQRFVTIDNADNIIKHKEV